jgi:hypothetical protein
VCRRGKVVQWWFYIWGCVEEDAQALGLEQGLEAAG